MKVVILAGGFGTRLSEETDRRPKPMVEIGGKPILWHIMKIYSYYGFNEFVICLGYRGYMIKEYFANYFLHQSDITIDLKHHNTEIHDSNAEPWRVTLVDTGLNTQTGGRLKRIQRYIGKERFMVTYGDGVGDVDIKALLDCHEKARKYATVTAVQSPGRFGILEIDKKDIVRRFREKPGSDGSWINGGFFVFEPAVFDYIDGDDTPLERSPLERLASDNQLAAYRHKGFWQPMDTLRDRFYLEHLWETGGAPWKLWDR